MAKHCEVCNLDLLDDYAFQGHLTGKKHLKNVQQMERLKGNAARSVYITWGTCYFTSDELLNFLARFGALQRYSFGPNFNYGIIQFQDRCVSVIYKTLSSTLVPLFIYAFLPIFGVYSKFH